MELGLHLSQSIQDYVRWEGLAGGWSGRGRVPLAVRVVHVERGQTHGDGAARDRHVAAVVEPVARQPLDEAHVVPGVGGRIDLARRVVSVSPPTSSPLPLPLSVLLRRGARRLLLPLTLAQRRQLEQGGSSPRLVVLRQQHSTPGL